MLKRKVTIHLDAVLVIVFLFVCSIGMNIVQMKQNESIGSEIFGMKLKLLENEMNLDSQQRYIEKLQKKLDEPERKGT